MKTILILAAFLTLQSCGNYYSGEMVKKSLKVCEVNEGLERIYVNDDVHYFIAHCKNSAEFTIRETK